VWPPAERVFEPPHERATRGPAGLGCGLAAMPPCSVAPCTACLGKGPLRRPSQVSFIILHADAARSRIPNGCGAGGTCRRVVEALRQRSVGGTIVLQQVSAVYERTMLGAQPRPQQDLHHTARA
jgi:hypothetical protein